MNFPSLAIEQGERGHSGCALPSVPSQKVKCSAVLSRCLRPGVLYREAAHVWRPDENSVSKLSTPSGGGLRPWCIPRPQLRS